MNISLSRPLTSYSKIQNIISRLIRGNSFQVKKVLKNWKEYLNVGCGSNVRPDYINLDISWRPGVNLCWDITKGIPLSNGSVKGIYSEHCLEHISYWASINVLKEFYRILNPCGVLRLVVPDAGLYLELYQRSKQGEKVEFPYVDKEGIADKEKDSLVQFTPMMAVNRIFRGYGHLFAYDFETIESMLKYAGFKRVVRTSYRKGYDQKLLIDSDIRKPQSLYLEAFKQIV